ncbi:MAG TPA: YwiC-like family protein [Candidatus Limnocylindrales bacterium]|nr:YwiC-like family protein [Candidatus Limnocylindrales bacterium]
MNAQGRIAAAPTGKLLVFPSPSKPAIRLLVPREHGTWGLLLFPLISGAIVGYRAQNASLQPALWFLLTALSAFLIYQPLESLLGFSLIKTRSQRQQRVAIISVIAFAVIATAGVLELFHLRRGLVLGFGLAALGCFGVRLLLGSSRRMRVPRQLIGALGLSSTAAGAYYAATGRIDWTSILLWLASWLFAAGQIEYVHLRISAPQVRPRRQKLRSSMAVCFLHLLMIGASITAAFAGFAPLLLALAFVPSVVRLSIWLVRPWRPLGIHILGVSELLQGLLFNILLIGAFLFHF